MVIGKSGGLPDSISYGYESIDADESSILVVGNVIREGCEGTQRYRLDCATIDHIFARSQ